MAGILIGKGELTDALGHAKMGLAHSRVHNFPQSSGDFLMDIFAIKSKCGDHTGALDSALEAASIFAKIGHQPKLRNALGHTTDAYIAIVNKDRHVNTWEVLSHLLKTQLAIVESVGPGTFPIISKRNSVTVSQT
jgi:hypothetical protein